jgi:hypothetical protein|tara:strand:+ start:1484 stop:1951 length:468 start_codon:yes stop_codon:yes gene_type:complete
MSKEIPFHPVNNNLDWTHPEDLKDYEKYIREYVYTKKGEVRKHLLKGLTPKSTFKDKPEMFINCQLSKFRNAHRVDAYMRFRSFKEFPPNGKDINGNEYSLDVKFFYDLFKKDCFEFFGIKCCPCCGEIVEDTQNPDAYSRFLDNEKELKGPTVH